MMLPVVPTHEPHPAVRSSGATAFHAGIDTFVGLARRRPH
jgi:hypothetical protein